MLFIGTQFSILYTSMYSPAEAANKVHYCTTVEGTNHTFCFLQEQIKDIIIMIKCQRKYCKDICSGIVTSTVMSVGNLRTRGDVE